MYHCFFGCVLFRCAKGFLIMSKIVRVFPRRTRATPVDALAIVNREPDLFDEADAVHVSVVFSWDLSRAEYLSRQWRYVAPVFIGGPATGERSGDFVPGLYLRDGYTITSRGCPNRCWFCSVWRREGDVRELPIHDGWNVLDDNLLACSESHVRGVFAMLKRQSVKPEFTGGLEARLLNQWHADALYDLRPNQLFFAYDTPDDLEPLRHAGKLLVNAGFKTKTSHALRCYVLCGWAKDTFSDAEARMKQALDAGFTPMAMLYRDDRGDVDKSWRQFQRLWARPQIIHARLKRGEF